MQGLLRIRVTDNMGETLLVEESEGPFGRWILEWLDSLNVSVGCKFNILVDDKQLCEAVACAERPAMGWRSFIFPGRSVSWWFERCERGGPVSGFRVNFFNVSKEELAEFDYSVDCCGGERL